MPGWWVLRWALGSEPFSCLGGAESSHGDAEGAALHAIVVC